MTYYGAEIKGYECESDGVSKWRIFYSDETNIYLIADDYIMYDKAPKGKNGSKFSAESIPYPDCPSLYDVAKDYSEGATWIETNSKAKKWLNQYLEQNRDSINSNIQATAYMMDTNAWSIYAGENAEYAIGGPTLELFCASYKNTHPEKYIEYGNISENGYQIKWNDGIYSNSINGVVDNGYNEIYIKQNGLTPIGMYIPSPSDYGDSYVFSTNYNNYGLLSYTSIGSFSTGLRPIVCLKSDVTLKKQDDGSYKIERTSDNRTKLMKA